MTETASRWLDVPAGEDAAAMVRPTPPPMALERHLAVVFRARAVVAALLLRVARGQVMRRHPAGGTSPVAKAIAAAVAVMAAVALEAARGAKGVALVATAVDDAGVTARPSRRVVSVSSNQWRSQSGRRGLVHVRS